MSTMSPIRRDFMRERAVDMMMLLPRRQDDGRDKRRQPHVALSAFTGASAPAQAAAASSRCSSRTPPHFTAGARSFDFKER